MAAKLSGNPNFVMWEILTFCNVFILNNKTLSLSQEINFPENLDQETSK